MSCATSLCVCVAPELTFTSISPSTHNTKQPNKHKQNTKKNKIVHDFEHLGVNNDFLVRLGDGLAITYNDRSPLENHHLAAAFGLLGLDEYNFLAALPCKSKVGAF